MIPNRATSLTGNLFADPKPELDAICHLLFDMQAPVVQLLVSICDDDGDNDDDGNNNYEDNIA